MSAENIIELKNIFKSFKKKDVLKDISLSVKKNEIFGLLGSSGAGKTTIINILTGQIIPNGGESRIFNVDTKKLSSSEYRNIGIVTDNSGLYDKLNCYDNLIVFARMYNFDKSRVLEVLSQVGLQDNAKTEVKKLSSGMRRRLIIARAILHKPLLIFLDEPTNGLDPSTSKEIHNLLLKINEEGTTFFINTHNMHEATKLCDRVALVDNGRIQEIGTVEELSHKYNTEPKLSVILKTGEKRLLPLNSEENVELISNWLKNNEVLSIHSTEPNLEEIFIKVTGRELV